MRISWRTSLAGIGLALLGQGPLTAGEFGMGSRSRFDAPPPGQGWGGGYSQDRGAAPQEAEAGYGMEPARNPWEGGNPGAERVAPEERARSRARHSSFFSRRRSLVPDGGESAAPGEDAGGRAPERRSNSFAAIPSPSRAHPEATPDYPAGGVNDEYKRHEMEVTRLQRKLEDAERDDNPRKIKAINWMIAQENERHDKELAKAERRETAPRLHAARHQDAELPPPQGAERGFTPPGAAGRTEDASHAGWLFGSGRGREEAASAERADRGSGASRWGGEADHDHGHGAPDDARHAAVPSEESTVGFPPAYATRAREVPVAARPGQGPGSDAGPQRFASDLEPARAAGGARRDVPSELGFTDREW